ncbi:hypothetical protein HAALTHF_37770n [Vreelandella aquamarina]|nr:hypothetical protein HAALTHF_37770n [Halomonas axialensis]
MGVLWACASHIGILRFNAMHQPLFDQKFQRAIDSRRAGSGMLSGELIQQIICFEAATVFCDKLRVPGGVSG